ncbi:MAG: phosphodiester glycosidase family protein [Bryobacterales bacterium]|nr:phosphodiester glycosidase family protein [Bryobacterales bacterium]
MENTRGKYVVGFLWLALAHGAWCQPILLDAPARVRVGDGVTVRVTSAEGPVHGAEVRAVGPAKTLGVVTATTLNVREGPGTDFEAARILYQGQRVLVMSETRDGWCHVILPNGPLGFVSCPFLDRRPFGQPFGVTDAEGRLELPGAAMVAREIEVEAQIADRTASAIVAVEPFEFDRAEPVASGLRYREMRFVKEGDPFTLQMLEVDPRDPAINIVPVRARDRAIGLETPSSLARRYGAIAAVNGGYFVTSGTYTGASSSVYQFDGEVWAVGTNRTSLAFCADQDGVEQLRISVYNYRGRVVAASGAAFNLAGINRARGAQEIVLYRPSLGPRTLTTAGPGVEAILDRDGRILRVEDGAGNAEIPPDGNVLSGAGTGAAWMRTNLRAGELVRIEADLAPLEGGCTAIDALGAGPRIVRDAVAGVTLENFSHLFQRHPRTAVAIQQDGNLLFVTLDGRQAISAGMRLDELGAVLVSLGAKEAINLDGGGSSALYVNGRIRNAPSDGPERAVGDAVLIFHIPDRAALERVFELLSADAGQMEPVLAVELRQLLKGDLRQFASRVEAAMGKGLSKWAARILLEPAMSIQP